MADRATIEPSSAPAAPRESEGGRAEASSGSAVRRARGPASARYYVCLGLLVLSALTLEGLARVFELNFRKQPVPLKKPLYAIDRSKLLPDYELHPIQAEPLSAEMIESLGTDEYLQWRVVDLSRDPADPLRVAHITVTYYTGKPDMVPHIPDECISAAGWQLVSADTEAFPMEGVKAKDDRIPVRVCVFESGVAGDTFTTGASAVPQMTVLYFFYTNGRYCTSRYEVRLAQQNLFDRYAYYSKIEVRFSDGQFRRLAGREESVQAARPLLKRVLGILLADHYQDWEALSSGQAPVGG